MKLSLLTVTGSRPEALALCARWIAEQTQQFDEWIIVDDGPVMIDVPGGMGRLIENEKATWLPNDRRIKYIRPDPLWCPENPINTQARNLILGLEQVTGDVIAIIEDDDCYMPDYLEWVMESFDENQQIDFLGESWTTFYNVKYRCQRKLYKPSYAALYQTSFRKGRRDRLKGVCERFPDNIDMSFWKDLNRDSGSLYNLPPHRTVGIKGLPGRLGIGVGNHMLSDAKHWTDDRDLKLLSKLLKRVPERVDIYAQYWRGLKNVAPE